MARTYRAKKRQPAQKSTPTLAAFTAALSKTFAGIHKYISKTFGKDFSVVLFGAATIIIIVSILNAFDISLGKEIKAAAIENGYRVQAVTIEGRQELSQKKILNLLQVQPNASILDTDLQSLHTRLMQNPWIRQATISRQLPNTIFVKIEERLPVARWQNKGKLSVVDDEGVILTTRSMKKFRKFPIAIGKNAPKHIPGIIKKLKSSHDLYNRVTALTLVSDRRWNIQIDGRIEIKLPENNITQAWKYLEKIEKENKVLNKNVVSIDLRLTDRLIIRERGNTPRSKARKT